MSAFDLPTASFSTKPLPDCLAGVPVTGDLEADSTDETSAVLAAFKGRNDKETKDKLTALDSEYWFCVCFQTREQKEAFLKAVKWFEHGDKYLDGQFVAKQLGVALPPASVRFHEREEKKSLTAEIGTIRNLPKKGGE